MSLKHTECVANKEMNNRKNPMLVHNLCTCFIFSLSCSGVMAAAAVMRRLFLNMAMRVLASLRWILGRRTLS